MGTGNPGPDAAAPRGDRSPAPVRYLLGAARGMMAIGIASLMVAATVLLGYGAFSTFQYVVQLVSPGERSLGSREVFLASIKLVDLVLLATVLEVVAIGLYSLFIDENVPAPRWMRTADFDGLKNKLIGIVVVMLGVLFLEHVITDTGPDELLRLGLATAAVILAMTYFIQSTR